MAALQKGPSKPQFANVSPPLPKSSYPVPRAPRLTKPAPGTDAFISILSQSEALGSENDVKQHQQKRYPQGDSDTRPWQLSMASSVSARRKAARRSLSRSRRHSLVQDDSLSTTARSSDWHLQQEKQDDAQRKARRSDVFDIQRPKDGEHGGPLCTARPQRCTHNAASSNMISDLV